MTSKVIPATMPYQGSPITMRTTMATMVNEEYELKLVPRP
jgi:hypothetical protein